MRLAILTEQPESNGSTWFRALQHVPRLRTRFAEVDVFAPQAIVGHEGDHLGRLRYFGAHGARYATRTASLIRRLRRYDAVLVQRGLYPMGPALVTSALARFDGQVVFDVDDALLVSPAMSASSRSARWLYGHAQALALLDRADRVIASTDAVAASFPHRAADLILPTVPDVSLFPEVERPEGGPLQVVWIGSLGNMRYLDVLRPVFATLAAEGIAELTVIGNRPWAGPAAFVPWSRAEEGPTLARFDVGVMPLPDTPYTRAKAGFKLLEYMAARSAVVASPVGVNTALVEDSGAGLLADTPREWDAALRTLAADPARRTRMAASGRRFIEGYADLDAQADAIAEQLRARPGRPAPGSGLGPRIGGSRPAASPAPLVHEDDAAATGHRAPDG